MKSWNGLTKKQIKDAYFAARKEGWSVSVSIAKSGITEYKFYDFFRKDPQIKKDQKEYAKMKKYQRRIYENPKE